MDPLLSSATREEHSIEVAGQRPRQTVSATSPGRVVPPSSRLTLSPEQLFELTGYKRSAQQARWLKENGFKFRLDRLGRPRVDRIHYENKMGGHAGAGQHIDGGTPNWAALAGA